MLALRARSLRCFEEVEFLPGAGINLVCGPNGAGKTTLLEGIHVLGVGRSFRTRQTREVCRVGAGRTLIVRGTFQYGGDDEATADVEASFAGGQMCVRLRGERVGRASVLARNVPIFFVGPEGQRLVSEGGGGRRALLDAVVFHVEPGFLVELAAYRTATQQRNAALRSGATSDVLDAWDRQCAATGERVEAFRSIHVDGWLTEAARTLQALLGDTEISFSYRRGWGDGQTLLQALGAHRAEDLHLGYGGVGPHRADVAIMVEGRRPKQILSRGELKLVSIALAFAQVAYVAERIGEVPVFLLDDALAELDSDARRRVLWVLEQGRGQSVLTCTSSDELELEPSSRVFHVKQGRLHQVV